MPRIGLLNCTKCRCPRFSTAKPRPKSDARADFEMATPGWLWRELVRDLGVDADGVLNPQPHKSASALSTAASAGKKAKAANRMPTIAVPDE